MLDRLADWLDRQPSARRRLYSLLIGVILLTLPCYAAGVLLLVLSDAEPAQPVPTVEPLPTYQTPIAAGTVSPDDMVATAVQRRATETPGAPLAAPTIALRPVLPQITVIPTLVWPTATELVAPATALPVPSATQPPPTEPPVEPTATLGEFVPVITQTVVVPPALLTRAP